ncbi:DUF2474 domain-containing protein [Roseovarius sp. M141]|nr:DUF2474 domain-containing protein [Roseovarius sp. M141]MCQ0092344.1 DUF2474 domain-containing protein [Roseovarius sp. M141]
MQGDAPPPNPLWRRLLWFVGIWLMSVAALGAVAYGIRLFLV